MMNITPNQQKHGFNPCKDCRVRSISVCAALTVDELYPIQQIAHSTLFPPRSNLFRQGDDAKSIYNVTNGMIRLYKLMSDGKRQILGFALPGDFLGLVARQTYGFSADAIGPVSVCSIPRKGYDEIVSKTPHLLRRLHEYATHELDLAQEQITLLGRRSAEERVVTFLVNLRERWAHLKDETKSVNVPLPMSRQDIADFLGLTIETVSRVLSKLAQQKKIVIVPDGVRILELQQMENMAVA